MPTKEQTAKISANNISTKFFRLQPEYMGTRRIRVSVCNVPAIITGEVLASFLSSNGRFEEVNLLRSSAGTANGEYMFRLCLTREGFQAIPEIITCKDRQMMVVVEGRRPRCWGCKQLGHITKFCPQKEQSATTKATTTASTTATREAAIRTEGPGKGQVPNDPKSDEGWKEVTRKIGKKGNHPKITASASPANEIDPSQENSLDPEPASAAEAEPVPETTAIHRSPIKPAASSTVPATKTSKKKKAPEPEEAPMETNTNLKRRRESGEGSAKKICPNNPPQHDPLEGTSTMVPQAPLFPSPEKQHPSPQSFPQQQKSPPQAPSLPSLTLSSFSSPELFPLKKKVNRSQSEARPPSPAKDQQIRRRTKSVSQVAEKNYFWKSSGSLQCRPGSH